MTLWKSCLRILFLFFPIRQPFLTTSLSSANDPLYQQESANRFACLTSSLLSPINFARTQGDSWWVQQTERAKSSTCFPIAPVTRAHPVKRIPRPWLRPPIHPVDRQRLAPRQCRGSRKHHPRLRHPAVAEAVVRPVAHFYPRAIPATLPAIFVIRRDVPYPEANEVWLEHINFILKKQQIV